MPSYRKKVCRVCGRIYLRQRVRQAGVLGWCQPSCYFKDYKRRREGVAPGEPPKPVDDDAIREPRVLKALANVLREAVPDGRTTAGDVEAEGAEETGVMTIEVVADRALVAQPRPGEGDSDEVEWVGRCWAWLTDGEVPTLIAVAVRDGEIVKLLEPGQVRRVRAMERTIQTAEGEVDGLEVWTDFRGFRAEPEPELRATARGLREGGRVRIVGDRWRADRGRIGTLLWFTLGVVEVDGKRLGAGLGDLEPLDGPDGLPNPVAVGEELRVTEIPAEALPEESGERLLEVVADRALVAQTRFGEDGRVGVEWVGRCWVWLTAGEAPSLMEVVVSEAAVARLLEPGRVRRVRAIERTVRTAEVEVEGLELRLDLRAKREPARGGKPAPDPRAMARGLWEGGKVRMRPERPWRDEKGRTGTLLRFSAAYVEVDGRRVAVGTSDLEAMDDTAEPLTRTEEAGATPRRS